MAQFDVYLVDGGLLLDVQTDLLGMFPGRLLCPLRKPSSELIAHPRLNPTVLVLGEPHQVIIQHMAAVRLKVLGRPVDNLDQFYDQIKASYDMAFNGF
jgi:hypothetical protein